jgi:hypothetical protein
MCNNNVFDTSTANNRDNNGRIYPNKNKGKKYSLPSFKIGGRPAFKSEEIDSTIESTNPFQH